MTLTEFLLARIAEDEGAIPSGDCQCGDGEPQRPDCADRIVAECAAKRQIVAACAQVSDQANSEATLNEMFAIDGCRFTLCQLATVYAEHPDYREEWTP